MKIWRNTKYILSNLTKKHRFTLREEHSLQEKWYMYISPLNAFISLTTLLFFFMVIAFIVITYTPILDLMPGYPGSRSREMLIQNIMRIDSLERQINDIETYNANLALIMSSKSPITREMLREDSLRTRIDFIKSSHEDSILRSEMESDGIYSLDNTLSARQMLRSSMDTYPPVSGVVLSHFSPKDRRYGVALAATAESNIVSIMQGTVISSEWSPNSGTTIYIQHPDDMLSIYKNNLTSRVSTGQRVKAGEVIGYIINQNSNLANTDSPISNKQMVEQIIKQIEQESDRFEFELWSKGVPVDPENYIVF